MLMMRSQQINEQMMVVSENIEQHIVNNIQIGTTI
jgi:hypothetical protein